MPFFLLFGTVDNSAKLFRTSDSLFEMIHCRPYHLPAMIKQRGHKVTVVNQLCVQCPPQKRHSCRGEVMPVVIATTVVGFLSGTMRLHREESVAQLWK